MKKKWLLQLVFSLLPLSFEAQVGINTRTPSAALDIVTKGNTVSTTSLEINNSNAIEIFTFKDNGAFEGGKTSSAGFSWGRGNILGTTNDIALGNMNTVTGNNSLVLGANNQVNGAGKVFGNSNTVTDGIVIGTNNTVSGGISIGTRNESVNNSYALGNLGKISHAGSLFIGSANSNYTGSSSNNETSYVNTTHRFLDQNGTGTNVKVGIGVSTPAAQLQTSGNMILGTASSTGGVAGYSAVVRDNSTGELKVASTGTGTAAPLNYAVYQLNNVDSDLISDFNTNINTAQYTVVVIGSTFGISSGLTVNAGGMFTPKNVFAFQNSGTWRLSADFSNAIAAGGTNGNWKIYCLIINNSLIHSLDPVTANLEGSANGSAPVPVGL